MGISCCNEDWIDQQEDLRRIVGEVQEKGSAAETAILFEVAGEETSSFQVHTHRTEDDREVVLMSIVRTLVCDTLLLDKTGLSADLSGDLVVRQTGGGENRDLLTAGDRVHGINGRDTGGDHLLGVFLVFMSVGNNLRGCLFGATYT